MQIIFFLFLGPLSLLFTFATFFSTFFPFALSIISCVSIGLSIIYREKGLTISGIFYGVLVIWLFFLGASFETILWTISLFLGVFTTYLTYFEVRSRLEKKEQGQSQIMVGLEIKRADLEKELVAKARLKAEMEYVQQERALNYERQIERLLGLVQAAEIEYKQLIGQHQKERKNRDELSVVDRPVQGDLSNIDLRQLEILVAKRDSLKEKCQAASDEMTRSELAKIEKELYFLKKKMQMEGKYVT